MARRALLLAGTLFAAVAGAQVPDVRLRLDALVSISAGNRGGTQVRFYDLLGRPATLGMNLTLESGFRVQIAQRFQRIGNDPDGDGLDEAFVEDPGIWRLGKQYLPFGSGRIVRESVIAAQGEIPVFEGVPMRVALFDGGTGRQRGGMVRLGGPIGASVAYGRHLGIAATAFTLVRSPDDSPGRGRGHRLLFGLDATRRFRDVVVRAEWVSRQQPESPADLPDDLVDFSLTYTPDARSYVLGGFTATRAEGLGRYRFGLGVTLEHNVSLETLFRFGSGGFGDAGIVLRYRY